MSFMQKRARPTVRNGYIIRTGRGYSLEELKEAGIDLRVARKSGVPVDVWRQTRHPENVDQLKLIAKNFKPKTEKASRKKKKE
jgi:large subunit ribosomal protein L13e